MTAGDRLFPLVDQNSSAESEIRDKPRGLDFSARDHDLNGFGIREGLDQRFRRRLSTMLHRVPVPETPSA